jgi:hypothetical protein
MKFKVPTTIFARVLLASFLALTLSVSAGAASERSRHFHVTKNCSAFTGNPGSFCTITSSDLTEIEVGSTIYYDYPIVLPTPTGLLDTDIVLYVGTGNWAVGHCTLDATTNLGICTFSDGTGPLAGFQARINVSSTDGINYTWDGTYSFRRDPDR